MSKHASTVDADVATPFTLPDDFRAALAQEIKNLVHGELAAMVADVEFRLGRIGELERRVNARLEAGADEALSDLPDGTVYVEDIVSGKHMITGYTLTANSPSAGYIAWTSLHIVYNGVDYTAADGSTNLKYTYFIKPGSGTSVTLTSSNTLPDQATLGVGGALLFVNNGGTPASITEESIPSAVGTNSVGTSAIQAGAVGDTQISGVGASKLSGVLATGNIPSLDASKVTTGAFATAQIPSLDASKITSGAFATAQIPALDASKVTTGTFAAAQVPALDASKISTGTFASTLIGAGTVSASKLAIAQHVLY